MLQKFSFVCRLFLVGIFMTVFCRLGAVSITTLSGPKLDKSLTVTWKWRLDAGAGDSALGSIAFDEGLEVLGGGVDPTPGTVTLGVMFPIQKILDLSTDWIPGGRYISLTQDLHLGEGLVIYLPDTVGTQIPFRDLHLGSYSGQRRTIYLDGDVSLASMGQTFLWLDNVIVDGQGHKLTLGVNQNSGAICCTNVIWRNMTLINAWNNFLDGVFTQEGTFTINGSATFKDMDFQVLRGYPFTIASPGSVRVEGTVTFGNFGEYRLSNYGVGYISTLTIAENSNLIVDNSSLYRNWYSFVPFNIAFESDTSLLTLQNSSFGVDNDRWKSFFAGWIGVADQDPLVLSKGKIIVKGASSLVAYGSGLESGARARLYIGDGLDPANDLNIEITPGSTLDLDVSDTNCLIKLQNVH